MKGNRIAHETAGNSDLAGMLGAMALAESFENSRGNKNGRVI